MYWRPISESDLSECLDIQPACLGDQIVGRRTALHVWKSLLDHPSFQANVIESDRPIAGHKILACGMGVFVTTAYADRELKNPRPGLNSRIIAGIASGEAVVLSRNQIGVGNAGEGIDFVNMYGTWRDGIMNSRQLAEVQALLGSSFVEHFAGYRFKRVLKEAIGHSMIALARATGTYQVVAEFPESESALAVATPESVSAAPYSVAAALYRYQPPVLRLRPAEQRLLAAALVGKTDAELSADLGLSIEAIKKRWMSIFERVEQFRREILSPSGEDSDGRGPQKRHRVVAYIRTHPEELRPFSWDAKREPDRAKPKETKRR
jgi:DNA-binding CsgD family transcriptional regulator